MTETLPTPVLDTAQARVLGCLIEKEATTPDAYPHRQRRPGGR